MRITSTHNPVIKYVRSLERATVRRQEGVYLAEGVRLLREAVRTGQTPVLVICDPESLARTHGGAALLESLPTWAGRLYEVDSRVFSAAAQTDTPAGALAVLPFPPRPELSTHASDRFGMILDRIADPGNAGTIARTVLAAGGDYVIATQGSVDLFSPKVVRSGMGAHFQLPLYSGVSWAQIEADLRHVSFVAASAATGDSIYDVIWPETAALVVGSEAHGLSREAETVVRRHVHIPMRPGVESLNAAVSAGICMYVARGAAVSKDFGRYK